MNFSLYIAKRYLHSKSSNNAINFITIIAIIGVILGAASLFIVLSGFAGLKDFTLQFSSIADPDLKAEPIIGKSFVLSNEQKDKLNKIEGIAHYSKVIEERIIIAVDNKNYIAYIKGVDEHYTSVVAIDSVIQYGSWLDQKSNQILVGWGISNNLSLGILDFTKAINIYVPKPGKGQITSTKKAFNSVKAFNIGIFDINEKLNNTYVFASIDLAKHLLSYKNNQISAIEFKLKPNIEIESVKQNILNILGDNATIKNRKQLNDALYKMLNTENIAVYLIFTMVLIIAFFNIIGSLIMMILDKKKSLKTLFNTGATVRDIRKIFFYQGSLMSIFGGFIGLIISLILALLQQTFGFIMITPSFAYPVKITLENFFIVFFTISILGIIASKIAAARVTKKLIQSS